MTIFSSTASSGCEAIRCSLSAFYTRPSYRAFASLLTLRALSHHDVTYLNVTPAYNTFPLLGAQGYQRYCEGTVTVAAALLRPRSGVKITRFDPDGADRPGLSADECRLLADHAGYGCISLVCHGPDGTHPFVFHRRRAIKKLLPAAHLIYCRQIEDFVSLAGNIGRYLALRGTPLVLVDTNGALPRMKGHFGSLPKYFKGPLMPRLGDLTYTELPILGL